jgi:hypothetical protein
MNRTGPLTADQANRVQVEWDQADGEGRKKLLPVFRRMPHTYIAVTGKGTGMPIVGLFPFGSQDYPFDVARETMAQLMQPPTTPLLYLGRWYATEAELPQEVQP